MDDRVRRWLQRDPDSRTRDELNELIAANDAAEIERRFAGRLAFGTAGLRGVVGAGPSRMNRLVVRETTAGLAHYLTEALPEAARRGVVLGYDGRLDSRVFAEDAASVLAGCGFRVHLADRLAPTPLCAYALRELSACAAVVITASHNPPEYNGYKVYWENGAQIIPPHDAGIAAAIEHAAEHDIPWLDFEVARERDLVTFFGQALCDRYLEQMLALSTRSVTVGRDTFPIAYTPLHGVGAPFVESVLASAGFSKLHTVAEQREPDGHFPTVRFPNPEEAGAMDLVLRLAQERGAILAIANDPDADRFAVAARTRDGHYRMLSGDQIGVLLGADQLRVEPERCLVATTIVSSQLLGRLAEAKGARYVETLTGFKWIINQALAAQTETCQLVFGYEEALGYSVGGLVRDKDGISAALRFCELAAELHQQGQTVWDALEAIYRQHGIFVTVQRSVALDPQRDPRQPSLGDKLRELAPKTVAGRRVVRQLDLNKDPPTGLPRSDVLMFYLAEGLRIVVRPSGTEPKVKCYYELRCEMSAGEDFQVAEQAARETLQALIERHQQELASL